MDFVVESWLCIFYNIFYHNVQYMITNGGLSLRHSMCQAVYQYIHNQILLHHVLNNMQTFQ